MRSVGCAILRAGASLALCIGLAISFTWVAGEASAQATTCPWTNDGDCDEPNGLGNCPWGTDVADCSNPNSNYGNGSGYAGGSGGQSGGGGSTGGLYNPCPSAWVNDGDCDEPEGTGLCAEGTDVADCSNPNSNYGNGSGYAGGSGGQSGGNAGGTTGSSSGGQLSHIWARLSPSGQLTNPVLTLQAPAVITNVFLDGQDFCIWSSYSGSGQGRNTGLCGGQSYPGWLQRVIGAPLNAGSYFAIVQGGFAQSHADVDITVSSTPGSGGSTGGGGTSVPISPRYIGCFVDSELPSSAGGQWWQRRDMSGIFYDDRDGSHPPNTIQQCAQFCANNGFAYAGLQFEHHCFCDNSYGNYGPAAQQSECNMACPGNPGEICGGPWRNSVWSVR